MPRPSGIVQTPARARASGSAPLMCFPMTWTHPWVGRCWLAATRRVVVLPGAVRSEQRDHAARRDDQVDAVQHLDPTVGGPDVR